MQEQKPLSNKKKSQPTKFSSSDYGKYSGMALQMGITITIGVYSGKKLDEWLAVSRFPVFTIILSLLSVFAAMYFVIRGVLKKK